MKLALRQHLTVLNDAAIKRVVKQFCAKYDLVYFGHVDAREDDHQLIRGITASAGHSDNHYAVGTFQGHDVMLVQRRTALTFPGKPDAEYKWLIMQFDLKRGGVPHIFMDAHRHNETFYANLFLKVPQFEDIHQALQQRDPHFAARYKIFALPHDYQKIDAVLLPQITNAITQHFSQFDFEIIDDRIYIYASGNMVTIAALQEMLRAGVWLADNLNLLKIPG